MQDKKNQPGRLTREATVSHPKISPEQLVEEIRKRAKEIFAERGSAPGDTLGDWLRAEIEIKSKHGIQK